MSQSRLYLRCNQRFAHTIASSLELAVEDEGLPVANFEEDESTDTWCVSVYVADDAVEKIKARFRGIADDAQCDQPIEIERLGDVDWVSKTLSDLNAVRAGRFLVHGSHDTGIARANEIAVCIDAGQAFGTGHHGTTAGCLDVLGDLLKRRRDFKAALDLGAGSGVLAIAYAKATNQPIMATDIDAVSTAVAKQNASQNGVKQLIKTATAKGLNHNAVRQSAPFDLIMANILAKPLEALASSIAQNLAPRGSLILSGLLPHQRARILSAYRLQGIVHLRSWQRDGWLTLELQKGSF